MDAETQEYCSTLRRDPCSYCGQTDAIEIDHIVPVEKGGTDHWSNFTASCKRCNASKGPTSLMPFTVRNPIGSTDRPVKAKKYGHALTVYVPNTMWAEFRSIIGALPRGDERGNISKIVQDAIKQRIEELKRAKGEKRS